VRYFKGKIFVKKGFISISAIILVGFFMSISPSDALSGYASIIVDADTGQVLRTRNADIQNYPASLTKIMTLYMTFEAIQDDRLTMGTKLRVSKRASGQPPSNLRLKRGDVITVKDAIFALVTKSANDVATVLAEKLGGTEWEFAQDMTKKARALGMRKTSFRNASGLPNRKQLSTARDMATLALALMKDFPEYYQFFSLKSFKYKGIRYRNHNKLLGSYRGVDGVKTGYIRSSGFNLVASAERKGRRVVAVVLGGKTAKRRDRHMAGLLDKGFSRMAKLDRNRKNVRLAFVPSPAPTRPLNEDIYRVLESNEKLVSNDLTRQELDGLWAVQVGAYSKLDSATTVLKKAGNLVSHLLDGSVAALSSTTSKNGKTLYRARFVGLQLLTARRACIALKASRIPCVVLKPKKSEVFAAIKIK